MRSACLFRVLFLLFLSAHAGACPVKSCCSMTRTQLESCFGVHARCPSSRRMSLVATNQCVECPRGHCRVPLSITSTHDSCVCPSFFLADGSLQALCETAHNVPWPDSAASTRPDLDRRHCTGAVFNDLGAVSISPPPLPAVVSEQCPVKPCCAMTRAELDACRGLIGTCSKKRILFRNTCAQCPRGTCSVTGMGNTAICVCPRAFFPEKEHARCRFATGKDWPESAGLAEREQPRCARASHLPSRALAEPLPLLQPTVVMKCRVKECCALSEEELLACRGVNENCPAEKVISTIARASYIECPRGLCRFPGASADFPDECRCPDDFYPVSMRHKNKELYTRCSDSHGAAWPVSAGRTRTGREHCAAEGGAKENMTHEVFFLGQAPPEWGDRALQMPSYWPWKPRRLRRLDGGELAKAISGIVSTIAALAAVLVAANNVL